MNAGAKNACTKIAALMALCALTACAPPAQDGQPRLGVGIGIGPHGLKLVPKVSTKINGVNVGASPGGPSIGTNLGGVGVGVSG